MIVIIVKFRPKLIHKINSSPESGFDPQQDLYSESGFQDLPEPNVPPEIDDDAVGPFVDEVPHQVVDFMKHYRPKSTGKT
jgi:hypothetical protein